MKNLNKKIAMLSAIALAGTMLAGCGSKDNGSSNNSGNSGNTTQAASNDGGDSGSSAPANDPKQAGTGITVSASEGKKVNIYCWNNEFKGFVDKFYKAPAGVELNWIEVANEGGAYQTALDEALQNQDSAAADDKVDMFLAEADYILKYANSPKTQNVEPLGVKKWDTMYDYTYKAACDTSGVNKGVSFQACPSVFIYRRSIAKDVLGTDDPDEVQAALSTWDKVDEVAGKCKDKGYVMFASPQETYRTFVNNATTSFLNDNKFAPTAAFNDWVAQMEKYTQNGWSQTFDLWSDEKQAQMGTDGKMFACIGPAWYFNFCMGTAQEQTSGDWAICVGPQEHFWGGTWILAATGSDNPEVIADLMNAFTANETICDGLVQENQFPNNTAVVNKYANDASYGLDFLGGQNHMKIMAECAKGIKWDPKLHTQYDQTFNEDLAGYILEYLQGTCSKDDAMNNFYTKLSEVAPQITHD